MTREIIMSSWDIFQLMWFSFKKCVIEAELIKRRAVYTCYLSVSLKTLLCNRWRTEADNNKYWIWYVHLIDQRIMTIVYHIRLFVLCLWNYVSLSFLSMGLKKDRKWKVAIITKEITASSCCVPSLCPTWTPYGTATKVIWMELLPFAY